MGWDDCFTCSDYDRYMGYDDPPEPEQSDDLPAAGIPLRLRFETVTGRIREIGKRLVGWFRRDRRKPVDSSLNAFGQELRNTLKA